MTNDVTEFTLERPGSAHLLDPAVAVESNHRETARGPSFRSAGPMPEAISFSAIIPTKNRPRDLYSTVDSILRQSQLPSELLVVDQSAGEESHEALERVFSEAPAAVRAKVNLIYIHDQAIPGGAVARNRAMDRASGDVWLFLDDDVVLETDFIRELARVYLFDPSLTGVSGVVTNYRPYARAFRLWRNIFVRGPFRDPRQTIYRNEECLHHVWPVRVDRFGGGLMSFRAERIRGLCFDEALRGVSDGEDVDFCLRLDPQDVLMMAPRARLTHNSSLVGREQNHWLAREARAQIYLFRRHWSHGINNWLWAASLMAGYLLVATLASARRGSPMPWRALASGIADARAIPIGRKGGVRRAI